MASNPHKTSVTNLTSLPSNYSSIPNTLALGETRIAILLTMMTYQISGSFLAARPCPDKQRKVSTTANPMSAASVETGIIGMSHLYDMSALSIHGHLLYKNFFIVHAPRHKS